MNKSKPRARYTLEFKLEAVRLVKGGQVTEVTAITAITAKIYGIFEADVRELSALGSQVPA